MQIPVEARHACALTVKTDPPILEGRVTIAGSDSYQGAWQRLIAGEAHVGPLEPGTYRVTVQGDGFWGRAGVSLTQDTAHTIALKSTGTVCVGIDRFQGLSLVEAWQGEELLQRVRVRERPSLTMILAEGQVVLIGTSKGVEAWRRQVRIVRGERAWVRQ